MVLHPPTTFGGEAEFARLQCRFSEYYRLPIHYKKCFVDQLRGELQDTYQIVISFPFLKMKLSISCASRKGDPVMNKWRNLAIRHDTSSTSLSM
jgi:hypothetical protein